MKSLAWHPDGTGVGRSARAQFTTEAFRSNEERSLLERRRPGAEEPAGHEVDATERRCADRESPTRLPPGSSGRLYLRQMARTAVTAR